MYYHFDNERDARKFLEEHPDARVAVWGGYGRKPFFSLFIPKETSNA